MESSVSILLSLLGLASLTSGSSFAPNSYAFNRRFTVGDSDTYAVKYTDSAHATNNPYEATDVFTVKSVNSAGGATVLVVTSNASINGGNHRELDPNLNGASNWVVNSLGVPTVPSFPNLLYLNAIGLGMQGLLNNATVGQTNSLPTMTGTGGAKLTAQSTLVSIGTTVVFHVTGTEALASGAPYGTLDCTFTLDASTSKLKVVNFTVTEGQWKVNGTLTRTSP